MLSQIRIYSGIALALLIFHFMGSQLLFHIQRSQVRKEVKLRIKQGVPEEQMLIFRFSTAAPGLQNLQWENPHEFRFRGRMYDVVRQHTANDSIYLYCIDDQQETRLFATLSELVDNQLNQGPAREQQQVASLVLSNFYLPGKVLGLQHQNSLLNPAYSPYIFKVKSWNPSPSSPPPRLIG